MAASPRVYLVSLGCPKNLVDSEAMLGLLSQQGYELTSSLEEARLVVINTCGFIQSAVEEGIETILEYARDPRRHPDSRLVVTGCMVQRYAAELVAELPEVDLFLGTEDIPSLTGLLADTPPGRLACGGSRFLMDSTTPRLLTTPPHRAYLKVTEGCNNRCAYCCIPSIRGPLRSRSLDDILIEASRFAQRGVQELTLVGQDLTVYGRDLGLREGLVQLLRLLEKECPVPWIRPLYLYPSRISTRLLEVLARCQRVLPYLDIPMQHVSDRMLRAMGRGYGQAALEKLLLRIRAILPQATVRTTLMVGFPGESEDDVAAMLDFLQRQQLDHVGVFRYEDEAGTRAQAMKDKVDRKMANKRYNTVMRLQQGISTRLQQRLVGKVVEVLVEGVSGESEHLLTGRTRGQAAEIDGCVYLADGTPAAAGSLVAARITEAHAYDFVGVIET